MNVAFTKTFPNYEAAARWLEERGFDGAVIDIATSGSVTVTLRGETAIAAIEAETAAKAEMASEAA